MKTYVVLQEGWLTNGRGHGAHHVPAKKGRKPVTIDMTEAQAAYLLASGQIGSHDPTEDEVEAEEPASIDEVPPAIAASQEPTPGEPEELTSFRNKRPR